MPGWNGGGVFVRAYNWVADNLANIDITDTRMDGEFDNYKAGLENCLTRDGQNSPSANINWGAKRITNLANGIGTQDAVTKSQLDAAAAQQWIAEVNPISFLSTVSFKVSGVDKTGVYLAGTKLRFTLGSGTIGGFVRTSSFSAPDTTVTVSVDYFVHVLDASLSLVEYSAVSPGSEISPQGSGVWALSDNQGPLGTTDTKLTFGTVGTDLLNEFASSTYTAKLSGAYRFSVAIRAVNHLAAAGITLYFKYNGVAATGTAFQTIPVASQQTMLYFENLIVVAPGAQIDAFIVFSNGSSNLTSGGWFMVHRV